MARPVGTGSPGVGTKETVVEADEDETEAGETKKDRRSGRTAREERTSRAVLAFPRAPHIVRHPEDPEET